MKFDLYQEVTDRILAMLEQGVVPWRSPILGRGSAGHPRNLVSGRPYRGVNVFLLAFTAWAEGYPSSFWLTFKQAKQRGGSIRKGEKSSLVIFWKWHEIEDPESGEPKKLPVLRYFRVFNVAQCENIAAPDVEQFEPLDFQPIDRAEAIVRDYAGGPAIEHGGTQAFYRPSADTVRMPEKERFASCEAYYATLFHELAHSTGHSTRLARGLDPDLRPFGSPEYGKEELVAEMTAAFLTAEAEIAPLTIADHAAYLDGWLRKIRGEKTLVVHAAAAAQRAADWIRGRREYGAAIDDGASES